MLGSTVRRLGLTCTLAVAATCFTLPITSASASSSGWSGTVKRTMSYDNGDHHPGGEYHSATWSYVATFDGSAAAAGRTGGHTDADIHEEGHTESGGCAGTTSTTTLKARNE